MKNKGWKNLRYLVYSMHEIAGEDTVSQVSFWQKPRGFMFYFGFRKKACKIIFTSQASEVTNIKVVQSQKLHWICIANEYC